MNGMRTHNRSAYCNGYCDCPVCRAAHADYQDAYRRRPRDPAALQHGSNSTYTNYGCRCAECRAANTARKRDYQRAKKARQLRA